MPSLEVLVATTLVVSLMFYVLFAGADFGAGVWYLLADDTRGRAQRHQIEHAIGPIWEANHVWLILAVVLLFAAFPPAFGRVMTVLHIPLVLLLLSIVARGSAFAIRSHDVRADPMHGMWGWMFAVSSVCAPVLLGMTLGSLSTDLRAPSGSFVESFVRPWASPFTFVVGGLALAVVSWLAAIYLWTEAADDLKAVFRLRAVVSGLSSHALAVITLVMTKDNAPQLWEHFFKTYWGGLLLAGVALLAGAMWLSVWRHWPRLARLFAAAEVIVMMAGWALGQDPYLVRPDLTIYNTAAPEETLRFLFGALLAGAVILFPSLYYLYRVFKGGMRGQPYKSVL